MAPSKSYLNNVRVAPKVKTEAPDGGVYLTDIEGSAIVRWDADMSIRKGLNPAETAALIQDAWQGAMQRMLVERSVAPLRSAAKFLRAYLREPQGSKKNSTARTHQQKP